MADTLIQDALLWGLSLIFSLLVTYPLLLRFLRALGMQRANYRGETIPVAAGLIIPIVQLFSLPWGIREPAWTIHAGQTFCLLVIAYAGWRDDRWGGNEAKGLRGHFMLWWREGRVSTGLCKAAITSLLSLVISFIWSRTVWELLLHFFILVMGTNLINLLDLRPGRAIKGFLLISIPLLALTYSRIPLPLWLPVLLSALFVFADDLNGKIMLGDTGSNVLGFAASYWIVIYAPFPFKVLAAVLAGLIHMYAEKRSITLFIQRIPFLNWLDMLGRSGEKI